MNWLLVGTGGFLGAISRYGLSRLMNNLFPFAFIPLGTLLVNILGAFLLSFMMTISVNKFSIPSNIIIFFGTGFLGAFTTFSTYTYETIALFNESPIRGATYCFLMIFGGCLAAIIGFMIGRSL